MACLEGPRPVLSTTHSLVRGPYSSHQPPHASCRRACIMHMYMDRDNIALLRNEAES